MIEDSFYVFDETVLGTKGLVFIGDEVLVYRRDGKTKYHPYEIDLPGGGVESKELAQDTFVREVREEFGLLIHPDQIVYAKKYNSTIESGKCGFFVVAKLPAGMESQVVFGNEGVEWMLLTVQEYLSRLDAIKVFQDRTKDYLNSLSM